MKASPTHKLVVKLFGVAALLAWFAFVVSATWPSFTWQLDYYGTLGPQARTLLVVALAAGSAAAAAFAYWRTRSRLPVERALVVLLPLGALAYAPKGAIGAAAVAAAGYAIGRLASHVLGLPLGRAFTDVALTTFLGWGIAAWLLFWADLSGALNLPLFLTLAVAPWLLLWKFRRDATAPATAPAEQQALQAPPPLAALALPFVGVLLLSTVAVALAPPIAFDSINFHLPLIEQRVALGHGFPSEARPYGYFPQSFEVLSAWAYALGDQRSPQILSPFIALLCLAVCWQIARRVGASRGAAMLATSAAFAIPAVTWMSSVVKNDFLMAAFQLSALLCLLRHHQDKRREWLFVAVFLIGAAFSVKHSALFAAPALLLLLGAAVWRSPRRLALAFLLAAVLSTGAVWHAKTFQLTGNPTYPSAAAGAVGALDPTDPGAPLNNWRRFSNILANAHTEGHIVFENVLPAPLGIFLALFTPLAFLRGGPHAGRERRARRMVALFVALSFFYWISTMNNVRYVIAPLLLLPVLIAQPLLDLWRNSRVALRAVLGGLTLYSFAFAVTGVLIINNSPAQLRFLSGQLTAEQYLSASTSTYSPIQAVNALAQPGDFTLALDCCAAAFYSESWRFHCIPEPAADGPWDAPLQRLSEWRYRFLIVKASLENRAKGLPPRREIYRDRNYVAYELDPTRPDPTRAP